VKKFEKAIVVTKAEWKATLDAYLERELSELAAEDMQDKPFEAFFKSGDMAKYIDDCIAEGSNPACGYGLIFRCNPNRDFELIKNNIKLLWDWIFIDVDKRLPKGPVKEGKDRKASFFLDWIDTLGTVNSPILDPVCAAKLFLWVYGEEFEPIRTFPMSFGKSGWAPQIEVNPVVRFADMTSLISSYLFDGSDIEYRQSLALVDYWLSIIPHLTDLRVFDTKLHEDRVMEYPRRQRVVRAFFANLAGYDVYEEYDELPHNDPELEQYIKVRLAEIEMPDLYYRMLEYIDEHKEKSLDNLWEED
jgi:hypothetical protein